MYCEEFFNTLNVPIRSIYQNKISKIIFDFRYENSFHSEIQKSNSENYFTLLRNSEAKQF